MKRYDVTFINKNGVTVTKTVEARHEFEAIQIAGAFNLTVLSVVCLD